MKQFLLIFLLLATSFNTWGLDGEIEETSLDYSTQYRETARLSWKAGLIGGWNLKNDNQTLFQFPAIVELQIPVSGPSFKWLLQVGGGIMISRETEFICNPFFIPEPPEPPFDSEFFQKRYRVDYIKTTNPDTCFKKQISSKKHTPYFISQTGIKYGSGVYGALQGGAMLSTDGDIRWTGELLIGKEMGWDISGGVQINSFGDFLYLSLIFLGGAIKQWWVEQTSQVKGSL